MFTRKTPALGLVLLTLITTALWPIKVNAHASQAPNYPKDPTTDTVATPPQFTSITDVQDAFNAARVAENAQLGTSIPLLQMPSQAAWDAMDDNARGLWLINRERIDRMSPSTPGLLPLQNTESNVTTVANNYANFLLANNTFGHDKYGPDPWTRMDYQSAINGCHDFLSVGENLYATASTLTSRLTYQVEMAIYLWMYADVSSAWGHRHTILWYPYVNNNGSAGGEGFIGFGVATGGPYQGPFLKSYPYAVIIVMNVFDPCTTWKSPVALMPLVTAP